MNESTNEVERAVMDRVINDLHWRMENYVSAGAFKEAQTMLSLASQFACMKNNWYPADTRENLS